ncbi:MAG: branched-chain amino acid transaminase [Anaerolineales bacterium]|nr:branched-chain amino acid transaminase [Anaerolineales bacterium]
MATEHPNYVWFNGDLVPWNNATVHLTEIAVPMVAAVFEGLRGYWNEERQELYVFGLDEHLDRLERSRKFMRLAPHYDKAALHKAVVDLLEANESYRDTYIRILVYFMGAGLFSSASEPSTHYLINSGKTGSELLDGKLCNACVSSWRRIGVQMLSPQVKAVSNYLNSRLAAMEALRNGYDDAAILLNEWGKVSEGPGECIFMIRDGVVVTPDIASGILESITRAFIIKLCQEVLELPVEERQVERAELYFADELFYVGTSSEIRPIGSVDRYPVGDGNIGPVTARLEKLYHDIVRGIDTRYETWRTVATRAGR